MGIVPNLDAAEQYVALGYHVFPVHGIVDAVCACRKGKACTSPGKHPRTRNGAKAATTNVKQIRRWWTLHPESNVGIATGARSGVVVVDVDPRNDGDAGLETLQRTYGQLPAGPFVRTGGGGWHLYLAHPGGRLKSTKPAPGVDVQADGAYVVAPTSNHVSGEIYVWERPPSEVELLPIPEKWLDFLQNGQCPTGSSPKRGGNVPQGPHGLTGAHRGAQGSHDISGSVSAEETSASLSKRIDEALERCLPTGPGQRHACTFRLARAWKGIPELGKSLSEVKPHFRRWHERALSSIRTVSFDDCWWDFVESWEAVKQPEGTGIMTEIIERARAIDPPPVAEQYDSAEVRLLITVCLEMQREAGEQPFFLSSRSVASFCEITSRQASRWLRGLVRDGVLELVTKGDAKSRKASEYRYLGGGESE